MTKSGTLSFVSPPTFVKNHSYYFSHNHHLNSLDRVDYGPNQYSNQYYFMGILQRRRQQQHHPFFSTKIIIILAIYLSIIFHDPLASNANNTVINNYKGDETTFSLMNGEVTIPDPLTLKNGLVLRNGYLLGSGGGGAAFGFPTRDNKVEPGVVLKVSWKKSKKSVENECQVLQVLEKGNVQNVERCLNIEDYPYDNQRVMITMTPLMKENSVASVNELDDPKLQFVAVRSIIQTLLEMLSLGVVTVDVQPLISTLSGKVLFIDMTEAKVLSPFDEEGKGSLSILDLSLVSSFCSEMLSLIPEQFSEYASKFLLDELKFIDSKGLRYPAKILDIISDQTAFMTEDTLTFINSLMS